MDGTVTISAQTIITLAALLAAIIAIFKYYNKVYDLVKHQKTQDTDISTIKKEQTLLVYAMQACLDGLQQLGANHTIPEAKAKLDKYINQQAHDQL
jgi:hypothetical protein